MQDFHPGQFVTVNSNGARCVVVTVGPNKILVRNSSASVWKFPDEVKVIDVDTHPAVIADRLAHPDPFEGVV